MELQGKRIVLGVTGGIAAYKAAELVRLLGKQGADVQVVMTGGATHFVTATTFQALSGKPVFTDQWDARMPNAMAHIDLSRQADLILVAPASADFIARAAQQFGRAERADRIERDGRGDHDRNAESPQERQLGPP